MMTNYKILSSKRFDRHLNTLDTRLNLSKEESREAIMEIKEAID